MTVSGATELEARMKIDAALRAAGWELEDRTQVEQEYPVSAKLLPREARGVADHSPKVTSAGRADYVLLATSGAPLAVVEAKRDAIDPYIAREQALPYAEAIGAPFIFLANGEVTYFWDRELDDARPVAGFHSRRDLERLVDLRRTRKTLAATPIPETYVKESSVRHVRPYQREAMRRMDVVIDAGRRRFLLELPTGTGKTDVVALQLKRMFDAGLIDRVLFLVDRESLADQADGTFQDVLAGYSSYWLRPGGDVEPHQITIALLQTMINRAQEFTVGAFDVVVMDECHRSIYGAWQPALTRFDAFHLGVTATPAQYVERNTFRFYECAHDADTDTWRPHFRYELAEAFRDGFLVPYRFAEGLTRVIGQGAEIDGERFDPPQFEREWTNEHTNKLMMEEFDRVAWESFRDLAPGLREGPGKGVVFAITKSHAARLARYLNELHPEHKGRYAAVVTADTYDARTVIRQFKRETLPAVLVSVGMLDTGFDAPEILHVVLCRPILSPILYQQIRGRGTRRADSIGKRAFLLYDFFRNRERFGDDALTPSTGGAVGNVAGGHAEVGVQLSSQRGPRSLRELDLDDEWLYRVNYVEVGPEGERVEKAEYIRRFEDAVRERAGEGAIVTIQGGRHLDARQEEELSRELNQPKGYFHVDNLRHAYGDPRGALVDFIRVALGMVRLRTRAEEVDAAFAGWVAARGFTHEQEVFVRQLANRAKAQGARIALEDLFEPPLSVWNADEVGASLFGESGLKSVVLALEEEVLAPSRKARP